MGADVRSDNREAVATVVETRSVGDAKCDAAAASFSASHQRLVAFDFVRELTGLSRSTVWRLERQGLFPQRRRISRRRVAWVSSEIQGWTEARTSAERVTDQGP